MTAAAIERPWVTISIALGVVAILGAMATTLTKEVGYSAFFGRDDPDVHRLVEFQDEFHIGLQLLVAFGCQDTPKCESIDEPWMLDFVGRLHAAIDELPNILSTTSVLNTPIVTGPLETQTLAKLDGQKVWQLEGDWRGLLEIGRSQPAIPGTMMSDDGRTTALLVELRSIDSGPLRDSVHHLFDLIVPFEGELGSPIYMAGEPIWSVTSGDMVERDSIVATIGIFATMFGLLWFLYRDVWMTILPLAAIGPLFVVVQGLTALFGIPVTFVLSAVPLIVLVIALTASIHYLTAFLRHAEIEEHLEEALRAAAREVGPACLWAAGTTALGFLTFLTSDLRGFRDMGLLSSISCMLGFVATFTLLPALIRLRARGDWRPAASRSFATHNFLRANLELVLRHPGLVLSVSIVAFAILAAGTTQLYYEADNGFGDKSFVVRSFRFIEANLGKSETLEVSVTLPSGTMIYDETSIRLLDELERSLEKDSYTGKAWSFLDLLQEAYRVDHGVEAPSLDEVIRSARRSMPIVASFANVHSFWREATPGSAARARISAGRGWLGIETESYAARVRATLQEVEEKYIEHGYRIELRGGLILFDRFVAGIETTQRETFAAAFTIVVLTLVFLLRKSGPVLIAWAIAVNLLPTVGVLGLMGLAGIGINLSSVMLGALLLIVIVDDTIHMSLRLQQERAEGKSVREALEVCIPTVGEAILTSSMCLSLGFCSMLTSEWAGLVVFGMLASIGILFALAADLLLLPAALLVTLRAER